MNLKNKNLFDTSALMALLQQETGYKELESLIANSVMSTVNYTEVITVLARKGINETDIDVIMQDLIPTILSYDLKIAICAGKLNNLTKQYGLSLGDRACIATGIIYNIPIYTADKIWTELSISNADIRLIR